MDRFYDDSSSYLGLDHADKGHVQTQTGGWVRGQNQDDENEAHFREAVAGGALDWMIEYMKCDPKTRDMRPSDLERTAYIQFFRIRGGLHDRVRQYVFPPKDPKGEVLYDARALDEAIMKAEADFACADDARPIQTVEYPDDSYSLSIRNLEELMDTHKKTKGGGSKSKRHAAAQKPTVGKCENCRTALTADLAVCQECGHEVRRRDPRGRKRFGPHLRVVVAARVDPETPSAFDANEQILGLWIDLCAKFARAGLRVEDVQLAVLDEDVA